MTTKGRRFACLALAASAACHHAPPATSVAPARADSAPHGDTVQLARVDSTLPPAPPPAVMNAALRLFGDSITGSALAPESDSLLAPPPVGKEPDPAPPPRWAIDVRSFETRERVSYYIDRFQNEARPRFTLWLERGGRYEPMIRTKLRAAGLPEDLTYLAFIESGYDPNAYSSAAAVGIWQLMTGTAQGLGIRVDWWIDERRDPVRSTDAAIRFLGWLHEQFGSLLLAAAAYNGGPGRVARGLTRYADELEGQSGDDAFFTLAGYDYLRAETRDYVPKLLAAAIIARDPVAYGFTGPTDAPLAYDSVQLGPAVPLSAVAKAAGVPLATIMELNNQVLRGITPPSGRWWVRVPSGRGEEFISQFASLGEAQLLAVRRISVKTNTTIKTVSAKYSITSRQFIWFNPSFKRTTTGKIAAGKPILIPTPAALVAARDVPDPAIERYGSSRRRAVTHVVKQGESLASIAERYGTSVAALKRLNGLQKSVIFPGQVIVVRQHSGSSRSSSGSKAKAGAR